MTSLSSHLKLTNLFKAIAEGEKRAEISRQVLAERGTFEPFTVFTRLDRDADGFLCVKELLDFFYDNEAEVTQEDMLAFIMTNSATNSEKLTYSDFLNLVLPKDDYNTRQACIERPTFHLTEDEVLPFELEVALMKVLHREVQLTRKLEVLKEDLVSNDDFSVREAFYALNQNELRVVDFDCIKVFFKHHRIFITDDDILNILNRTDSDTDRVLNYKDFARIVLPIHIFVKHFDELCNSKANILHNFVTPKKSPVKRQQYSSPNTNSTQATPIKRYSSRVAEVTSERKSINKPIQERTSTRSSYSDSKMARQDLSYAEEKEKQNDEEVLIAALEKYNALEKEVIRWKNQLSLRKDFNLFDAFRLFDKEEKGYVTEAELKKRLSELGIHASYEEASLLISKYNGDEDGLKELVYGDFCEMLMSNDESYADLLKKRRPTYAEQKELIQIFSSETKDIFRRTLQALLVNELYSENLRQQLSRKSLDKVWNAFQIANRGQKGTDEFKDLINKHGVEASSKELAGSGKKSDKIRHGKISYEEFAEGIKGKSPLKH